MPIERQGELGLGDAVAVVGDADQPLAAVGEGDVDPPGAGVERILDQLLDRRRRPLDHLAGSDPIGCRGVELADRTPDDLYLGARHVHAPRFSSRVGAVP